MEWTEEVIERLRTLWDEGHSTAEIGRRLGTTKNAVVGKAHRLKLPTRPSPIKSHRKKTETAEKSTQNELFVKEAATPKAVKEKEPAKVAVKAVKAEVPKSAPKAAVKRVVLKKEEVILKKVEKQILEKKIEPLKEAQKMSLDDDNFDKILEEDFAAEVERLKSKKKSQRSEKREKLVPQVPKRLGLTCQWPFGDPGDADFHFCGDKIIPGRPYCLKHCEQAYVRKIAK